MESAKNIEEFFSRLGRFAAEFENTVHAAQHLTARTLQQNGLIDQQLAIAVTTDQSAQSVRSNLLSIMGYIAQRDKDQHLRKVVGELNYRLQKLTRARNAIIHRSYQVVVDSNFEPPNYSVVGHKLVQTSEGPKAQSGDFFKVELTTLTRWTDRAKAIQGNCWMLHLRNPPFPGFPPFVEMIKLKALNKTRIGFESDTVDWRHKDFEKSWWTT